MNEETKTCRNCRRELPKSEFWSNPENQDGLETWCKVCLSERKRKYFMICEICGKVLRNTLGGFKIRKYPLCHSCFNKKYGIKYLDENREGVNNSNWKGNNVSYSSVHKYVRKYNPPRYGKDTCFLCEEKTDNLQLANITGIYNRDFENYAYLCSKCHARLDKSNDWNEFREVIRSQ